MKVLIQQVNVFGGIMIKSFHEDAKKDENFLLNVTMKSAKEYADRMGYDYHAEFDIPDIIDEMPTDNRSKTTTYFRMMKYTYIKYLMLEKYKEYDYILLLDSDTLVMNDTPELPFKKGLSTGPIEWERSDEAPGFEFKNRFVLTNAGFLLFDSDTAGKMYSYIIKRINSIIKNNIPLYQDEHELMVFMNDNQEIIYNELEDEWNHWRSLIHIKYIPKKYIYHFTKQVKCQRYENAIKMGFFDGQGNYCPK